LTETTYLKFLQAGRRAAFSGATWPPPGDEWVLAEPPVRACVSGVHVCRGEHLGYWLNQELWIADARGIVDEDHSKVVAERGQLVRRVDAWDGAAVVTFARECAERTRRRAAELLRREHATDAADALEEATSRRAVGSVAAALKRRGLGREPLDAVRYAGDAVAQLAAVSNPEPGAGVSAEAARAAALASHIAGVTAAAVGGYDAERRAHGIWLARQLELA
jgi:hypothetical protein